MSSTIEQKELGSQAWKDGNFSQAIDHFSNAIDSTSDKELLKVLYSNRSACHLKLKQNSLALIDSNKCIDIDVKWTKGYMRKGDALYADLKYTEAYNAYNAGLRFDGKDTILAEKAEKVMNAIAAQQNGASTGRGWDSQPSSSWSSGSPGASAPSAPLPGNLGKMQVYGRYFMLVNCLLYLLPFGSFSTGSYRRAILATIVGSLVSLYGRYGMPKFSMEYGQRIIPDPNTMLLFLSFLLITNKPYFLGIASLFLTELQYVTTEAFNFARGNIAGMSGQLNAMIARFAPSLANRDLNALFSPSAVNSFNAQLLKTAASLEVMQGVFLIVELLLPSRNFMFLFLWWQFLQMRYMIDTTGNTKSAFAELDRRISWVFNHNACPKAVAGIYLQIKSMLAKQVQPPNGNEARPSLGSMFSKCTVM